MRSWVERGTLMSDDTWQHIVDADAILFGAIGAPEYDEIPATEHQVDWLLEMRRRLDLYQNLRPIRAYDAADRLIHPAPRRRPGCRHGHRA